MYLLPSKYMDSLAFLLGLIMSRVSVSIEDVRICCPEPQEKEENTASATDNVFALRCAQ